uniref:tRNA (guanosine(46)-N7)-methyltransferase TrmB n=1 Tax=Pararhizobium sp. IMCC3301 TaxID=3067904 RepID=UPI002740DDD4|nr:tRNA (guanosine(46)-N7)-methyltransferase TrmB [Pararhizobium sp. IMCC3301]
MIRRTKRSEFIGRRKTKPLKPAAAALMDQLLPQLKLDTAKPAPAELTTLFNGADSVFLEIGFGSGEHLLQRAEANPAVGFIGVEPFVNGLSQALVKIDAAKPGNIRLHDDDAGALLDWLPAGSLGRVFLLYPDPWPKFKHWKRRFVSQRNLDRIERALKPGGLFLFASDIEHYVGWTLNQCHDHQSFRWVASRANDWSQTEGGAFDGWPGTRYEAKAIRAGRQPSYLTFERVE